MHMSAADVPSPKCLKLGVSSGMVWFALLSTIATPCSSAQTSSSSRPTSSEVPIESKLSFDLYRGYLIVTRGTIGDIRNAKLLIDTGTDPSVIDKRIAERMHSRLEMTGLDTIHTKVATWRTTVPSFLVGPVATQNSTVLVEDLSFLERDMGIRIDALIGLDVLRSTNFLVDYRSHHIRFGARVRSGSGVRFIHNPPFATVAMTLEGRPVQLLLDTGASSLMLFRTHWPTSAKPRAVKHSMNLAGDLARQLLELNSATLGDLELGRQTAYLVDDEKDAGRDFDGLINPGLLGLRQIFFDFENRRLAWDR